MFFFGLFPRLFYPLSRSVLGGTGPAALPAALRERSWAQSKTLTLKTWGKEKKKEKKLLRVLEETSWFSGGTQLFFHASFAP